MGTCGSNLVIFGVKKNLLKILELGLPVRPKCKWRKCFFQFLIQFLLWSDLLLCFKSSPRCWWILETFRWFKTEFNSTFDWLSTLNANRWQNSSMWCTFCSLILYSCDECLINYCLFNFKHLCDECLILNGCMGWLWASLKWF